VGDVGCPRCNSCLPIAITQRRGFEPSPLAAFDRDAVEQLADEKARPRAGVQADFAERQPRSGERGGPAGTAPAAREDAEIAV